MSQYSHYGIPCEPNDEDCHMSETVSRDLLRDTLVDMLKNKVEHRETKRLSAFPSLCPFLFARISYPSTRHSTGTALNIIAGNDYKPVAVYTVERTVWLLWIA